MPNKNKNSQKNLIPLNERSQRERKEIQSKGAKASNEVKKNKKLLRDIMTELLELPCADIKRFNVACKMGMNPEEFNNKAALVLSIYNKAVATGDIMAFKEIKSLIGEDEAPNNDTLQKLDEVLNKISGNI